MRHEIKKGETTGQAAAREVKEKRAREKKEAEITERILGPEKVPKSGPDYSELVAVDCAVSAAFHRASELRLAVNKALSTCVRATDAKLGVRTPPTGWHRELCAVRTEVGELEERLLDLALETTKYTY